MKKDTDDNKKPDGKGAPDTTFKGPLKGFQAERKADIARKKSERKKK